MRLIDADTLKGEFTGNFMDAYPTALVHAIIDSAPTIDAVPVVRCINCIYRICDEGDGDYDRYRCSKTGLNYGPYFFCADGYSIRREDRINGY